MFNHSAIFIFAKICFCFIFGVSANKRCDCEETLQIYDSSNRTIYHNFTKQSSIYDIIDGQPSYFSIKSNKLFRVSWSSSTNKWKVDHYDEDQKYPFIPIMQSNKDNNCTSGLDDKNWMFLKDGNSYDNLYKFFFSQDGDDSVIKSRCLTNKNICLAERNETYTYRQFFQKQ